MRHPYLKILVLANHFVADTPMKNSLGSALYWSWLFKNEPIFWAKHSVELNKCSNKKLLNTYQESMIYGMPLILCPIPKLCPKTFAKSRKNSKSPKVKNNTLTSIIIGRISDIPFSKRCNVIRWYFRYITSTDADCVKRAVNRVKQVPEVLCLDPFHIVSYYWVSQKLSQICTASA